MANLKIIYKNLADSAVLTASGTAGSLVASNMQFDRKSLIWRSDVYAGTITAIWDNPQQIDSIILAFCNIGYDSRIIIRGYDTAISNTPSYTQTFNRTAVPKPYIGSDNPVGVNYFAYGGGRYARMFLSSTINNCRKLTIDIQDTDNPQGYIEISRLIVGKSWSPTFNTGFGLPVGLEDTSIQDRAQSGDLVTSRGPQFKKLSLDLTWMNSSDKSYISDIGKLNGKSIPIFVSVFPNDSDSDKEYQYQIYGKLTQVPGLSHPMHTIYSTQLTIEEV